MEPAVSTRVSVVIPTLNARRWVGRAIASALAQTCSPAEVIVVDDGSDDGTLDHVRACHPSVVVDRSPRTGVSAARNHGVALARGGCIALLDADDVWAPWKLERQLEAVAHHPEWGMCVANGRRFRAGEEEVDWSACAETRKRPPRLLGFASLLRRNSIWTSSALVRRPVLDQVGGFDEELTRSEDHDLWLRIAHSYPIFELGETLVGYQVTPGSLSRARLAQELDRLRVIERWRDVAPSAVARALRARGRSLTRKLLRAGRLEDARTVYRDWACRDRNLTGLAHARFALLRGMCRTHRLLRSRDEGF